MLEKDSIPTNSVAPPDRGPSRRAHHYLEWRTLRTGWNNDATETEVNGTLLVGEKVALGYEEKPNREGQFYCSLRPAFSNGVRAWFLRKEWEAGHGYNASATFDVVITFEEGVRIFLERGVFAFSGPC